MMNKAILQLAPSASLRKVVQTRLVQTVAHGSVHPLSRKLSSSTQSADGSVDRMADLSERKAVTNAESDLPEMGFRHSILKLRTWLPDNIYAILKLRPTGIPSSLPGLKHLPVSNNKVRLPLLPRHWEDRLEYLENERNNHPRELIYRFYACGGFWIASAKDISLFLKAFTPNNLVDAVPFIREVMKIKIKHPTSTLSMMLQSELRSRKTREYLNAAYIKIYNELFCALASQGRDNEFLSLWNEASSLGIRFDWRAYMLLFQCFYNSPSSRIHEAIDAYHEYRQSASPSKFGQGAVAKTLSVLILSRITPATLNEDLTFNTVVDLTMQLCSAINIRHRRKRPHKLQKIDTSSQNQLLNNPSAVRERMIAYFRLCGRLKESKQAVEFYHQSRKSRRKFTPLLYAFALYGASHDPNVFPAFSRVIKADMAADGQQADERTIRALLGIASNHGEIDSALQYFKFCDQKNIVDAQVIRDLAKAFSLPHSEVLPFAVGAPEWAKMAFRLEYKADPYKRDKCLKNARLLYYQMDMAKRLQESTTLPFSHLATTFSEHLLQYICTLFYFIWRYPQHLSEPFVFNSYLAFACRWNLDSVPAIFRDCYNHFPLTPKQKKQLEAQRIIPLSRKRWHWPIPSNPSEPILPPTLPRPDKYTFVRAMEYAHDCRDTVFAREVWFYRQHWRRHIQTIAENDVDKRWSEVAYDDIERYEHQLVDSFTSTREWARTSAYMRELSDGASKTLYEGFTRLLYVQTLARTGFCDEAFKIILQGTGEQYEWSYAMLVKVRNSAELYKHTELMDYIDGLDGHGLGNEMEEFENEDKAEDWYR